MSEDVDRVLKDYLTVIDRKDGDHFKVLQRNQELEALVLECQARLHDLSHALESTTMEKDNVTAELRQKHQTLVSMDEELTNYRKFTKSIRKVLVLDEAQFSLSEVLHVLCSRLEDYGVVSREYMSLQQVFDSATRHWQSTFVQLELEQRQSIENMFINTDDSIRAVLDSAADSLAKAQKERDEAVASATHTKANANADARSAMEAITVEIAHLRKHTEQLLSENKNVKEQLLHSESHVRQLQEQVSRLESSNRLALRFAEQQFISTLETERELRFSERNDVLAQCSSSLSRAVQCAAEASSESRALAVVNVELRTQLAKSSKMVTQFRVKSDTAKNKLQKEQDDEIAELRGLISEARQKIGECASRERMLQEKVKDACAHSADVNLQLHAMTHANEEQQHACRRLEHSLQQRIKENQDLKQLLSSLQERSAQVRQLVEAGEEHSQRLVRERDSLRQELEELHKTSDDQRSRVDVLQSALRDAESALSIARATITRDQQQAASERLRLEEQCRAAEHERIACEQRYHEARSDHLAQLHAIQGERDQLELELQRSKSELVVQANKASALKQQFDIEIELLNAVIAQERRRNSGTTPAAGVAATTTTSALSAALVGNASMASSSSSSSTLQKYSQDSSRLRGGNASALHESQVTHPPVAPPQKEAATDELISAIRQGLEHRHIVAPTTTAAAVVLNESSESCCTTASSYDHDEDDDGEVVARTAAGGGGGKGAEKQDLNALETENAVLRARLNHMQHVCDASIRQAALMREESEMRNLRKK